MVHVSKILDIVFSTLLGNTQTYNTTADINGILITLQSSYSGGTLTLQGDVTIQGQANQLVIEVYVGTYLLDSISSQVQLSPGTYTFIYQLTITDSTGIINNTFGYAVTNQLKSVSVSTNASSYVIAITEDMLTFYLSYTQYPTSISITVTFTLTNGNTTTGSFTDTPPSLPQGVTLYATMIPVTFEL